MPADQPGGDDAKAQEPLLSHLELLDEIEPSMLPDWRCFLA